MKTSRQPPILPRRRRRRPRPAAPLPLVLCVCVALGAAAAPVAAQRFPERAAVGATVVSQRPYDDSESELVLLSANALLGGTSAGLVALLRGERFADAFALGALGGGISFAGRKVVTAEFTASGLLGRQIGAVGNAIVADAGRGRPPLSELWLPVGPLQLGVPVRGGDGRGWGVRLDLTSTGALLYALTLPELELDGRSSLEQGAAVFHAPEHRIRFDGAPLGGMAAPGVILLSGDVGREPSGVLGHEMVHILQLDFMNAAWSYPLEEWVRERFLPRQAWLASFPIGGTAAGLAALLYELSGDRGAILSLMEGEAYSLTGGRR